MSLYRKILIRRDTDQAWESVNPVLGEGELGLSLTAMDLKIGDGTTAWTALPYLHQTLHEEVSALKSEVETLKQQVESNTTAATTAQTEVDDLEVDVADLEAELGDADDFLAAITGNVIRTQDDETLTTESGELMLLDE